MKAIKDHKNRLDRLETQSTWKFRIKKAAKPDSVEKWCKTHNLNYTYVIRLMNMEFPAGKKYIKTIEDILNS